MKKIDEMRSIIILMKNVDRQITLRFEKQTDISLTRYEILYKLFERGPISQNELKLELKIDQAAITRHLKLLEEQEFVVRQRNSKNNREVLVSLTDTGRGQLNNCQTDKNEFLSQLFDGFSEEEVQQFKHFICRLNTNTEKLQ